MADGRNKRSSPHKVNKGGQGHSSQGQKRRPLRAMQEHIRPQTHPDITFWRKCIRQWYPDLLQRTYFIPPVYMNKVEYLSTNFAGLELQTCHPPRTDSTRGDGKRLQTSSTREDKSFEKILSCVQNLAARQKEVMFVVSQLNFGDYIGEPAYVATAERLKRPRDLKAAKKHRGDFDMLLLHKHYGVIACEVKTIGDNFDRLKIEEKEQDKKVVERLKLAFTQLDKAQDVLLHILSDLQPPPHVRKAIMFPNISKDQLERILHNNSDVKKDLSHCLEVSDSADLTSLCLCANHISDVSGTNSDVSANGVTTDFSVWWLHRVAGPYVSIADNTYEDLIARFCGPATTVKVFSPTEDRISLHTEGEGVSETARRFSSFVLHPSQLEVLSSDASGVYLTGPPGTGKTLVLVLKCLDWLQKGFQVHVVSTWWGSLAASHLITHQVKVTNQAKVTDKVTAESILLHTFDLETSDDVEEAVRQLGSAIAPDEPLCVVADEICGREFAELCDRLTERVPNLKIWAASLFHHDRPSCLTEVRMTQPLRTPPAITCEVQRSYWFEDEEEEDDEGGEGEEEGGGGGEEEGGGGGGQQQHPHHHHQEQQQHRQHQQQQEHHQQRRKFVLRYSKSCTPLPSQGPQPLFLFHQGEDHSAGRPGDCERCGVEIARVLRKLHVGQNENTHLCHHRPSENIKPTSTPPPPLLFRDVFILTANVLPDAALHDSKTDEPGEVVNPASGLLRGLHKEGVPVHVLRSGDSDAVADVVEMAGPDAVIVGEVGVVRGLERKVVVWVQTDRPASGTEDESFGRLDGASRATGQLVWVVWPNENQPTINPFTTERAF